MSKQGECDYNVTGLNCVVTGGAGLVGGRLCEMLVERGAKRVVSFDINKNTCPAAIRYDNLEDYIGDLTNKDQLRQAFKGADCVWHIAAVVGPYHKEEVYMKVNYYGTINVIEVCKELGIKKIVMSSSPSTRHDGKDIKGLRCEDQMYIRKPGQFVQMYAESKAYGEMALREACDESLYTVAIAPHQVYGPGDGLFLASILNAARKKKLRIFGRGKNRISFTHVDNYCHALILGYHALYSGSPALGKFYLVTDDQTQCFWDRIDEACVGLSYESLHSKFHLPAWLLYTAAYIFQFLELLTGKQFLLKVFSVRMMLIDRYFDISCAKRDLKYTPIIEFDKGWKDTINWFKDNKSWWIRASETKIRGSDACKKQDSKKSK